MSADKPANDDGDDEKRDGRPLPPPPTTAHDRRDDLRRNRSRVSFHLPDPNQQREFYDDGRLSRSDPSAIVITGNNNNNSNNNNRSSDPPRNRRRLYRDMSYTSRAVPRVGRGVGGTNNAPTLLGITSSRNDDAQHSSSSSVDDGDIGGSREIPGSTSRRAMPPPPRRQESFRGIHRTGQAGRAGGTWFMPNKVPSFANRSYKNLFGTEDSSTSIKQYYIPPPEESNFSVFDVFGQLYSMAFGDVAMWVYGASFGKVLLFFLTLYMAFVYCFVVLLYLVDKYKTASACILEGGELSTRAHFELAFELSWTTFTTVGYGNVGPPPDIGCYPVRLVCSVEAILGMAFVSMCSGLFYAKLLRLLGRAPVTFSSTLCVQYGDGLKFGKTGRFRQSCHGKLPAAKAMLHAELSNGGAVHAFPVIEFRIVNNRANHALGKNEIWDADVTALVQLSVDNDHHENSEGLDELQINESSRWQPPATSKMNGVHGKGSQKVYYELALKPSFHPYFSRVWFLRHTLDATSPLLRREVRDMIKDRSDGWDPALNNYRDIRACLVEFNSLHIIMSGASALSRSEVYAEKMYTYEDICVGWRFIAVCYEDDSDERGWHKKCKRLRRKHQRNHFSFGDDTTTRVDLSLIHDIVPQRHGDFEPL